jgi:esterase
MPTRTINGYELSYAEAGTGTPLVLIHGTLADQRHWTPQMEAFAAKYHVYALSLRHYWPAKWDGQGPGFTIAQQADDVAAFIRSLGTKAHLLGHSRGGHIAFRVAEAHPELIDRLILAEPGGDLDESLGGTPGPSQAAGFNAVAAEIAAGRIEEGLRMMAERTGGPNGWTGRPEWRRQVNRDNAMTMLGQINEGRKAYTRAAVASVKPKTLLLNGNQTQPNFIKVVEAMLPLIPNVQHVVIRNATHGLNHDNPTDFNAAVLAFLAG